jgi:hypothetical protein
MGEANGRPRWVGVISLFFLTVSVVISLAYILALTGTIAIGPAQQAYLDNLTPLDYLIIGSVITCNLLGALCLLRSIAFAVPLLVVGWAFGAFDLAWQCIGKGGIEALGSPGILGFVLANVLSLIIIGYALSLARRGILR